MNPLPKITTSFLSLLSFAWMLPAELTITGGHLVLAEGVVRSTTPTTIEAGAVLNLASGTVLLTPNLLIQEGGTLRGCGDVGAIVENHGLVENDCGEAQWLRINNTVNNAGVIRAVANSRIVFSEGLINDGILDLIFSSGSPPNGVGGSGLVVTAATQQPLTFNASMSQMQLQLLNSHSYQLQYTDDLSADPVIWTGLGTPLSTSSNVETRNIDIPLPATGARVYRYVIEDNLP